LGIAKTVEKIQDNQEHGVELINILSAKQSSVSKLASSPDASISSPKKSDNPYCLWCWIVVCIFCGFIAALFIAAVFLSLIISLTEPVMKPQCEKLERQLSNGETSVWGVSSTAVSILSQDEDGTTLIMPCDGIAVDEIGNEYQVDGAYKISCNSPVTFNYVTGIKTWRTDHCCSYPSWKYSNRNHGYSKAEGGWSCFLCDNCCRASVTFETTPLQLEFCVWVENFDRKLYINGVVLDETWTTQMTLQTSPVSSAPYGFWRNDSSVFIDTSDWLYIEKTAFNYSCMPNNPNPGCGTNLRMPDMNTASGMPVLQQCTMLVKIPAELFGVKIEFCKEVMLIHNTESDTIGIKTMGQSCMVKIQEGEKIQNLWISEGSYRFFRQLSFIACPPKGWSLH
jgi:hypothetical protein